MANKFDISNFNLFEFSKRFWDMFGDPNPKFVEIPQKDENGNIVNYLSPNDAQKTKKFWDDVGGALGQFNKTVYVNQGSGRDNDDGSENNPFKTLQQAINVIPTSGVGKIILLDDYVMDSHLFINGKHIVIQIGDNSSFFTQYHNFNNKYRLFTIYLENNADCIFNIDTTDTDTENTYIGVKPNDTGLSDAYWHIAMIYQEEHNSTNAGVMIQVNNRNPSGIILNLPADVTFLTTCNSSGYKQNVNLTLGGYYTGKVVLHSTARILKYVGNANFNYGFSGVSTVDESGNTINDIKTRIIGIRTDTNGVPRNLSGHYNI